MDFFLLLSFIYGKGAPYNSSCKRRRYVERNGSSMLVVIRREFLDLCYMDQLSASLKRSVKTIPET